MKMFSPKLLLIVLSTIFVEQVVEAQQVPCYFIFGDSLVDNGNNNNLITIAKANYLPYGIDFPLGPTGRFCNGRTAADFIGQHLGFTEFIPPFAAALGPKILKGVNYGSGAAGILENTGYNSGERISMDEQLKNHEEIIRKIEGMIGTAAAQKLVNKCIYSVSMGSDDYINNYFMPQAYPASQLYTPDAFASLLIQKYEQQLKTLYLQGARKVAVYGLGLLGCAPEELLRFPTNGTPCVDNINEAVAMFNVKLKNLTAQLNSQLPAAKYTYLGVYNSTLLRSTLDRVGSCCEINVITGLCKPLGKTCPVRNGKIYWDGFHPTEVANQDIARYAYNALTPEDAFPYDINDLALLL